MERRGYLWQVIGYCLLFCLLTTQLVYAWPAHVMHIYDGDTMTVAPCGDETCPLFVRLYGIDAPELNQEFGQETRQWLVERLKLRSLIEVIPMGVDNYGRVIGLVAQHGSILNAELVTKGYAWVSNSCVAMVCRSLSHAQKKAAKERIGLWAKDKPQAPWQWRAQERGRQEQLPLMKPESVELPK
ncbi:MAG: thermonuclease family protein [Desulfovibrionaceae bacterium]|nr:thermonuclease family protein [Desulfovibrionaceae bacterium]